MIEEISENANAQEFPIVPEREYQQGIEQKEVHKTVADVTAGQKQKEPVPVADKSWMED